MLLVDRPLWTLSETARRAITVQPNKERCTEVARARQVADMAMVQQIEHAVGKDERPRYRQRRSLNDFSLELGPKPSSRHNVNGHMVLEFT